MGLTVYRLYVYFVESRCNKSARAPSSSLYPQNVHYDVPIILFYFILGRIVTGDIKRLVASVSSLACGILTLCIRTNSLYRRTHTQQQTVFDSVQYILTENVVIARESRQVHTFIYRIFLLSHTEQGKFIAYNALFRRTFRDNAVSGRRCVYCAVRAED
jgi:hypothetical protein